jgi:hypothetical protein
VARRYDGHPRSTCWRDCLALRTADGARQDKVRGLPLRSRPTGGCTRTGAPVAALPLAPAAERQYRWANWTHAVLESIDIERLVRRELDRIGDPRVVDAITALLVSPRCEQRTWDYGPSEQTYPCWIVLEHLRSNTAIAYSDQGFGPGSPWGLLWLAGEHSSMGMDSGWFTSLEDAFRGSMACDFPPPSGYEVA